MSDVDLQHYRSSGSSAPVRGVARAVAVLALLATTATYVRVGWWRMESACSLEDAHGSAHTSVSYSWSWQPLGFQCRYDDGKTSTSLWL